MKVSLLSPKWNKMVNSYPSLGLGYLAAVAEQEGHEVRIHDMGLDPKKSVEEEVAEVVAFGPDLVGATAMTTSWYSIEQAIALVKEQIGCPVVIGGPHATTLPEITLQDPHVDFVVHGEGEETFRELTRVLQKGERQYDPIAGLLYKNAEGETVRTPERPLIPDLDALPFPARHLFQLERYPLYNPNGERMVTILSSRGCPYICSFCFKGIVGRTYRQRSPENVVAEIEEVISRYAIRNFYFIDDLFTINVPRLEAIMDHFIAQELNIRWQCLARVDRVTAPLLKKMHRAGCREIHYGVESGNEEILKATAKHIKLGQVQDAVTWTEDAGIRAKGYFILGLPNDTRETMEQTIEFAAGLGLSEAMFSIATPMPGTQLWDELVSKHPETRYSTDFSQAYYYNSYTSEIAPFLNVSTVDDAELSAMALRARERFLEEKRRRRYRKYFGANLGDHFYQISQSATVRKLGRNLLHAGFLSGFQQLKEQGNREVWT